MLETKTYISRKNEEPVLEDDSLKEFKEIYHTLGNMIIVPKGFNTWRALPTGDYWGISQLNIEKCLGEDLSKVWRERFFLEEITPKREKIERQLKTVYHHTTRKTSFDKFLSEDDDKEINDILALNQKFIEIVIESIEIRTQKMYQTLEKIK
ncbi:hypothetical protein Hs30E_17000 [Lactococcus hodotermopsidis]|uniref:Uncharacterized protein n=1 Tax=Pseudolactococcus hodotermopsidis TaxID=2709157 RepID=A0A6A0BCK1_9LACT|nr:hypothetical protein [Lactococcus hodotermopsidis]GFH43149.1 hypothetical protein Hs30E_17000 [Lactococcus hodotermopsidis]